MKNTLAALSLARYGMKTWEAAVAAALKYKADAPEVIASKCRHQRMGLQIPELLDRSGCDLLMLKFNRGD